ncbi:MAG: hypothetical protein ACJA0V_002526 [Planctomycetota bacterium]|jgi:hypothetical protein
MATTRSSIVLVIGSAALLLGSVAAQTPPLLRSLHGDYAGHWLGWSVQAAGDVNRDGYADLLVGAPFDGEGAVKILSGFDGVLLHELRGQSPVDAFGVSVACAGDVNADGWPDVIVGAHLDDDYGNNAGSAWVYSGHDFSLLHTLTNSVPDSNFGWAVAGAGDVDHDGHDDVIVGAPKDQTLTPGQVLITPGSATVFSGATGAILFRWFGDGHDDRFGHSVDCAGDVDGDGWVDLIVGAPWDDNSFPKAGMARVFSSNPSLALAPVLHTLDGDGLGYEFGTSVCGAGDVDLDGYNDLFIGQPEDKVFGDDAGSAVLFSGFAGTRLHTWYGSTPYSYFGFCVDAGDVDGDGVPDMIVGEPRHDVTPYDDRGAVHVYSGADYAAPQSLLYSCFATYNDGRLGHSVAAVGDTNGDGFGDFAAGVPQATTANGNQSGHYQLWGGTTGQGNASTHGAGCPASSALALSYGGQPQVGQPFDIVVSNGPSSPTAAWVVFGFGAAAPFPLDLASVGLVGCTQYQQADLLAVVMMTGGTATLTLTVPSSLFPAGIVFYNQALALDATSSTGLRISNAGTVIMGQ